MDIRSTALAGTPDEPSAEQQFYSCDKFKSFKNEVMVLNYGINLYLTLVSFLSAQPEPTARVRFLFRCLVDELNGCDWLDGLSINLTRTKSLSHGRSLAGLSPLHAVRNAPFLYGGAPRRRVK